MSHEIVVICLGLTKNVYQVHAIDAPGQTIVRRRLRCAEVLKFFTEI